MDADLKELERVLGTSDEVYLSTSLNDMVTARPVSPLGMGLTMYVRTSMSSRKGAAMAGNPHVAVCAGRFYYTGEARLLGPVHDEKNAGIKKAYMQRFPGAFTEEDDNLAEDEVFFEITPRRVSQWIYEGEEPVGFAETELRPMRAEYAGGSMELFSTDEKAWREALALRNERDENEFWISPEGGYPCLVLTAKGESGCLHFFPEEGSAGFQPAGYGQGLEPGSMWGWHTLNGEECSLPAQCILPYGQALAAALEFIRTGAMPRSINWFEL